MRTSGVHERVHPAELLDGGGDGGQSGSLVGEIHRHRGGTPTHRRDLGLECSGSVAVLAEGEHDIAAPLGEHAADRGADSAAATCDEHCS